MLGFLNQSIFNLAGHKPKGHISSSGSIDSRDGMRAGRDPAFKRRCSSGLDQSYCLIECDTEWSIESSDRWVEYEACDMDWAEPLGLARFSFPVIHSLSDLIDDPTFDFNLEEVGSYWEFGKRRSIFKTLTYPIPEYHPIYMHGGPKDGGRMHAYPGQGSVQFPYLPPEKARAVWHEEDEPVEFARYETILYKREKAAIGRFVMPVLVWSESKPDELNEWLQEPGSFAKLL